MLAILITSHIGSIEATALHNGQPVCLAARQGLSNTSVTVATRAARRLANHLLTGAPAPADVPGVRTVLLAAGIDCLHAARA